MAKVIKTVKKVDIKKSKKELLEEAQNANDVAVENQVADVVASAYENAIAVDTSSLPHFAEAATATAIGGAVVTDATAVAATTATTIGGISMGTIALGALAIGGVAAAASGGGGSSDATPTDLSTPPTDTGSITYERILIEEAETRENPDGSLHTYPAKYASLGILSDGKDVDVSTLTGMPSDFMGFEGKRDSGVNEIKLTLADVLNYGVGGEEDGDDDPIKFFMVIGGSEDIVDIDLENWTDAGTVTINDAATASLNGNYHMYTANGAQLMILEGTQVI